jgi:hypothetical protein
MTKIAEQIEKLLQEADECEMLGGLAASHEERVAHRQRAEELRSLSSKAQILLEQSEARMIGRSPQKSLLI